jgi:2,5-furandicarboxylate decarboxylase 1
MARDLRQFLDLLAAREGRLVEIDRPVRPHALEVTALLSQLEQRHQPPTALFINPLDQYDRPSPFRLVSNCYATRARCALMMGADPSRAKGDLSRAFLQRKLARIAPEIIAAEQAPIRQNVWTGDDADVGRLPIVKHFEHDLGPVLTMTHIMRALEDGQGGGGQYNVSFAKTFYKWSPTDMVASFHTRDSSRMTKDYEDRGEPMPVVNVIGHHPAFHLGSLAGNPWEADDYETIGSFMGEPLRLTPSVTWGDRFMVPADAEIVIEGEVPPGARDICDPFGEVALLYQAQCLRPVFKVKAITFRNQAIVQDIFSGHSDCFSLGALPKEAALIGALSRRFPKFRQVHFPDSGCGIHAFYLSAADLEPGEGAAMAHAALEIMKISKCCVVVDDDIDVFNEREVLWAVHTYTDVPGGPRSHGPADFVSGFSLFRLTFAATNWKERIVIDATRPKDQPTFPPRARIPQAVIDSMPLSDYLAPARGG